jgi:hypothetical protein
MLKQVETIVKLVEILLRGGSLNEKSAQDSNILLNESYSVLKWYSCGNQPIPSDIERKDGLNLAIKLHNKSKNLTSNSQVQLKNILKAISGHMLLFYGDNSPKVFCPVIKILTVAGKDLQHCAPALDTSFQCLSAVVKIWSMSNITAIQQTLPPLELQEMKIAVFQVI